MKRMISIILIIMITVIITGCGSFNIEIQSPNTKTIIEGQWRVKEYMPVNEDEVLNCDLIGSVASFGSEEILMFGDVYNDIKYKAKVVDGEEYTYKTLGLIPKYLNIDQEEIIIVTISSNNIYLNEIIVVDDYILIVQGEIILKLEKISDIPMENINDIYYENKEEAGHEVSSGVLLGFKAPGDEGTNYKTLWITYHDGTIESKELPYILLPRKSGFFKVDNKRIYNEGWHYDNIELKPLGGNVMEEVNKENQFDKNVESDITFIGNDYMSVRSVVRESNYSNEWLNTFLIDMNTSKENSPIDLGKISEQKSITDLIITSPNNSSDIYIENINRFTNYAIERTQGRWCFFTLGNKNSTVDKMLEEGQGIKKSRNVEIPLRVSKNIARHDELFIPWQGIKKEVPSAIDAISSPNKNMAIIKTKSNLHVYKINNNVLEKEPEITIPLEAYETIIMAEWAMGEYVGYWTDQVEALLKGNK
ncbi:MAG: hypothetical protein RSA29_00330 [Clostridium sp.]|uniref:hypothetical protein n=1 Tax=Clostridium sp. TaxID=1506 RepID=UPI00302E99F4